MKRLLLANVSERLGATEVLLRLRRRFRSPWLPVLASHRVRELPRGSTYPFDDEVVDTSPATFEQRIATIARYFDPIGIDELAKFLDGGALPDNPVLVTFDDGYRDNRDIALPILQRHGVKAVFFIATSYLSARRTFWWDRVSYLVKASRRDDLVLAYPAPARFELRTPAERKAATRALLRLVKTRFALDLERFLSELATAAGVEWNDQLDRRFAEEHLMTWDDVRALRAAGMDVEAHTRTHRVLETLPEERLAYELQGSKADLEREIGGRVRAISYPVGRPIPDGHVIRRALRDAGYEVGFSYDTGTQPLSRAVDRYDVRRIGLDENTPLSLFRAMMAMPAVFDE